MGGLLPLALLLVLSVSAAAAAPQLAGAARGDHSLPIIQEDIIRTVNNHPNAGWTAGHNPYLANYTIEQFKHILGVKPTPPGLLAGVPTKTYSRSEKEDLPKEFDARSKWSGCSTIGKILDQGHCGACWAFGAVECLQDRFCIHHGVNVSLSVNDIVACCGFLCGDGCEGGYPIFAWQYFVENGVVTDECDPFFDQVGCQHPGCEPAYPTPVCEKKCKVQNQVWEEKKHFSVDAYQVNSDPPFPIAKEKKKKKKKKRIFPTNHTPLSSPASQSRNPIPQIEPAAGEMEPLGLPGPSSVATPLSSPGFRFRNRTPDTGEMEPLGLQQLALFDGDDQLQMIRGRETELRRWPTVERLGFVIRRRLGPWIDEYDQRVWPSCSHGDKGLEVVRSMLKQATDRPIEEAYLEAFRRLPVDAMPDLAECAYLGGHCIGILDPVSNIILNTLSLLCRRRAGIYSPSKDLLPPTPVNPHIRNTWSGIAFDSYCALLAFMRVYFRYLSEEQARFYIHLASGDLLVAICIAEIELRQSSTIFEANQIKVCHPELFRDRAKFALRIAAIKVDHPMPDDLLLLFQGQPTEAMRSLLVTLEEGHCLCVDDVETFIKVLHYQHLMIPTELHLTLPRAPSSPTESGSRSCPRYCFNLNNGGGTIATTLAFQRRPAFNLVNLRSFEAVFRKIKSSVGHMQGFTRHTPMEVADAAPTCHHIDSIKMSLIDIIHAYYVQALAKLPSSTPQRLLHGILAAGHCYGLLDPVSNIIMHAVWYDATASPQYIDSQIQPDILCSTTLRRLELSSLNGLIAAVRAAACISEHKAVQYLRAIRCNLSLMSVMWQSPSNTFHALRHASKAANHPLAEHHISSLGILFELRTIPFLDSIFRDGGNPLSDATLAKLYLFCAENFSSSAAYQKSAPENVFLPEIVRMRHKWEHKQLFLREELRELLRLYAIQHPWEPLYKVKMICGVDEHTRLFYSHCYHLNFLAAPQASAPRVLFFAQILKSTSQSTESDGGSFCCPLPYYDANNPFPGRCSMCEVSMSKIIHPSSGAHIDSVHTEPKSTVDFVYACAPNSMKCYQTRGGDPSESKVTYFKEPVDLFACAELLSMG